MGNLTHHAECRIGARDDDVVDFNKTLREADRAAGLDHVRLDGKPLSDLCAADVVHREPVVTICVAHPLMHADIHRLYVHAGVDPNVPFDQRTEKTLLWNRYADGFLFGFGSYHVVHGHDSFPDGPRLYEGRTNLDTRAWRTGRLVIGVFDAEKAGGPIDSITVTGPAM